MTHTPIDNDVVHNLAQRYLIDSTTRAISLVFVPQPDQRLQCDGAGRLTGSKLHFPRTPGNQDTAAIGRMAA